MIKLPEINEAQKEALIAHCKECLEIVDRADANIRKSSKYQSPYLQNLLVEHQTQRLNYLITLSYLESPKIIPDGLHQSTAELVIGFATALAEKLHLSEQKYGWSDGWKNTDWQEKCLEDFNHHIDKGDPRDVAAYCAFMWFHGWQTKRLNATAHPDDGNDGYVKAFYDIAGILGIPAQPNSPKHVFETVIKPKLQDLAATAQPVSDKPSLKAMMRALDAFYADESVPEAAMMKAFRILLADVMPAAAPGGQDE